MNRLQAVWLAVEPLDMRAGIEAALARVVHVLGAARPHRRVPCSPTGAKRMKVLVHDGIGVWLGCEAAEPRALRRFVWPREGSPTMTLMRGELHVLVLGPPWQRIGEDGVIRVLIAQLQELPMR